MIGADLSPSMLKESYEKSIAEGLVSIILYYDYGYVMLGYVMANVNTPLSIHVPRVRLS